MRRVLRRDSMTDPHLALPHTSESYRVLGYTEDRIRKRFWRCVRTYLVSICHVVRAVVAAKPGPYERAWLTSINAVGLIVVLAVIFDISTLLGSGRSGVFQRALYPLVPPAGNAAAFPSPPGSSPDTLGFFISLARYRRRLHPHRRTRPRQSSGSRSPLHSVMWVHAEPDANLVSPAAVSGVRSASASGDLGGALVALPKAESRFIRRIETGVSRIKCRARSSGGIRCGGDWRSFLRPHRCRMARQSSSRGRLRFQTPRSGRRRGDDTPRRESLRRPRC